MNEREEAANDAVTERIDRQAYGSKLTDAPAEGAKGAAVDLGTAGVPIEARTVIEVRAVGNGWVITCEHHTGEPGTPLQRTQRVATSPRGLATVVRALAELYAVGDVESDAD